METEKKKSSFFSKFMKVCIAIVLICIVSIVYTMVSKNAEINGVKRFAELCRNEFEIVDFDISYKNSLSVYVSGTKSDTEDFVNKTKRIYSNAKEEKLYIKNFTYIGIQLEDSEDKDIWICNSVLTDCKELKKTNWNEIRTYEEFIEKAHIKFNDRYIEEKYEAAKAKHKANLKKQSIQGQLLQ